MNNNTQIKTHFDLKIILFLAVIFVLSSVVLAFEINTKAPCTIKEFKIDAPTYKAGELITFSDNSKDSYEWRWYFGDGSEISYRSKVGHAFSKPGKYTIKLLVNNNCSVEKTITIIPKKDVINEALLPKFYAPKVVYQGDIVKFKDSTAHATSWEWRFGDGSKIDAIDREPSYIFRTPGPKVISLVVNGDIKYVKTALITVLPSKKEKKDMVIEKIKRRGDMRADAVEEYFSHVPDAPGRSPEIANVNEEKLKGLLLGVSEDKLSYQNLLRHFCTDALPLVEIRKGKTITLQNLDGDIRNRAIRIRKVSLIKDKDNCVTLIKLDYKYKSIF